MCVYQHIPQEHRATQTAREEMVWAGGMECQTPWTTTVSGWMSRQDTQNVKEGTSLLDYYLMSEVTAGHKVTEGESE